jgi:hypothetical protein
MRYSIETTAKESRQRKKAKQFLLVEDITVYKVALKNTLKVPVEDTLADAVKDTLGAAVGYTLGVAVGYTLGVAVDLLWELQ